MLTHRARSWFGRLVPIAALAMLAAAPLFAASATLPQFAQTKSDLKPDPAAHFGVLENGLRYVVLPNHEPKGRASLRLLVLAGSLNEDDDQRGLAHFLEHMAFNGGDHFAPGTLVNVFQRMGMSFGGDTNASTSFDQTIYLMELPDTKDETLTQGLHVLADDAGGLLLLDEKVEKERGIVLSEKRVRDSVEYRTQIAEFEFALGSTRIPSRLPIGLAEVIEKAPRQRVVDFWNTWYRPEKMAVIIVGDVDPAAVEKLIKDNFSGLKARGDAKAEPSLGAVAKFDGVRYGFHAEAEAAAAGVSISCITPWTPELDTAENRVKRLPRQLAVAIVNRRLSVLAKQENAPFTGGRISVGESFRFLREAGIDLTCKPEQWQAALALGEQELRRALQFGFQASELQEATANYVNALEQAAKSAATRHSSGLAMQIAGSIRNEHVFTAPADDLALLKPALEKITPAECAAALREAFVGNGRLVMVSGNVQIPGDASAAIASVYEQSAKVAVTAPAAATAASWAYTDFGPAGKVTKREHVDDLDLTLVTFANGVRLNLKKTDFAAGHIHFMMRVGTGLLSAPRDLPGLPQLAGTTFRAGGLGKHSVDDLQRLLAGKNVGYGFQIGADAFEFFFPMAGPRGGGGEGTTREDLGLELQYLAASLTDPGYRPEALRQARRGLEQAYLAFEHTSAGPMNLTLANLIAGGDSRFGMPPKETMMARNFDEVRAWLTPQLSRGALEIAVVGDLDVDATIDAVARTLGALPTREAKPELAEARRVVFPVEPFTREFKIASQLPKGVDALYWPTTDGMDVKRARRLNMLNSIFSDRLRVRIREELGGTYSPRANISLSDTFPGYGYITTAIDVDPPTADKIANAVIAVANDLATKGVTAEELERARLPILTAQRESLRTNAYWLGNVLSRAQEKPQVLDWARSRTPDTEAITTAELSELAKTYLGSSRVSRATILPAVQP